jgi:hypothetical protein
MDIDPVDGGPKEMKRPPPARSTTPGSVNSSSSSRSTLIPMHVSEEEEARQAIEMLRGDDVSARVAAANRLESVATVLGEQRTREVSDMTGINQNINGTNKLVIVSSRLLLV